MARRTAAPVRGFDLLRSPPRVALANFYPFAPSERVGRQASESSLFVLATSGSGRIQVGPEWFSLHTGAILHVPWDTEVLYEGATNDPFVVVCLHFDYLPWHAPEPSFPAHRSSLESKPRTIPSRPQPFAEAFMLSAPPDARLFELATSMVGVYEQRGTKKTNRAFAALLRGLALQFLADFSILTVERDASGQPQAATASQARVVREVVSYLQFEMDKPLTRPDLARRAGISEAGLTRAFRAMTGKGPIDYLIDMRLAKARQLLVTSRARVGEVAAAVGIPDACHFSKLFKKRVGRSPREYRARRRLY